MASLVSEKDIAEALSNGDGARLARLATAGPIRTLAYLDGWMRGLIVGPRPAAELEWLVKMDVVCAAGFLCSNFVLPGAHLQTNQSASRTRDLHHFQPLACRWSDDIWLAPGSLLKSR